MPSIDDEDETLCLLAADQEESPGPRQPGPCGGAVASYNQVNSSLTFILFSNGQMQVQHRVSL